MVLWCWRWGTEIDKDGALVLEVGDGRKERERRKERGERREERGERAKRKGEGKEGRKKEREVRWWRADNGEQGVRRQKKTKRETEEEEVNLDSLLAGFSFRRRDFGMEWVSVFNLLREKPVRDERRFLSTMEEVVSKFSGKITLSKAEQEEVIHVKTHDFEAFKTKLDLSLVGKVLTTKPFSRIDLKTKMVMAWNPTEDMKIREIDNNLFLFVFGNMEDKQRVLDNGPWHFDNALLVLDYTDGTVSPSEMKMNHADLWVQVHNLPLLGMNVVLGRRIANYLGKYLEVEEEGDGECWGKYMRVRVRLDVMQPLRRGMKICLEGCEPIWVDFKYEGIPEFCYHCGIWGHNESECEVVIGKERRFLFVTFSRMWEYVSPWVGLWSKEEEAIDFGSGNEELKERNSKLSHTEGLERKGDQEDLTKGEDMERPEVIDESKECSPKLSSTEGQESNGDQEDLSNLTKGEDMEKPEVTEELKECSLKCSHTEGLGSNGDQQDLHRVGFKFGSIGLHEVCADSSTKSGFQFGPAKPEPLKETRVIRKVIRRNRK